MVFGHTVLISLFSAVFGISAQNRDDRQIKSSWACGMAGTVKLAQPFLVLLIKLIGQDCYRGVMVIGALSQRRINRAEVTLRQMKLQRIFMPLNKCEKFSPTIPVTANELLKNSCLWYCEFTLETWNELESSEGTFL